MSSQSTNGKGSKPRSCWGKTYWNNYDDIKGFGKKKENKQDKKSTTKTGIECPQCHNELLYADNIILTSYPPQRRVFCDKCNYSNTIVC